MASLLSPCFHRYQQNTRLYMRYFVLSPCTSHAPLGLPKQRSRRSSIRILFNSAIIFLSWTQNANEFLGPQPLAPCHHLVPVPSCTPPWNHAPSVAQTLLSPSPLKSPLHNPLPVLPPAQGLSLGSQIFFACQGSPLRTTPRDHQPPTANRHQPPTANRRQPPPTANRQPPPTANRQPLR